MKNSFILYHEYQQHFELLSDEELGKFMRVIFNYEITGKIPKDLSPMQKMAFSFIKKDLDDNREKYNATIEAKKANGSKGGRPKKEESEQNLNNLQVITETEENLSEPKKPVYVSVSDTVSEYDNVSDTASDAETPQNDSAAEPLEADEAENDRYGKSDNTPYKRIKSLYNSMCERLPKIKIIDGDRKKAVAARFATYKDLDFFKTLFEMANASDFLCGTNERNWRADFDWLMSATNIPKVVEGKYDNKEFTSTPPNNNSPPRATYPVKSSNPFADYVDKCENDGEEIYYRGQC